MVRIFYIAALVICCPAYATDALSDAFGIVPKSALSPERGAWAGMSWDENQTYTQTAGTPSHIQIFAGPKSLEAGVDIGHAVALVFDASGNLAENGHRTVFHIRDDMDLAARTEFGIADVYFGGEEISGVYSLGASIGDLQSPRTTFRVVSRLADAQLGPVTPLQNDLKLETLGHFTLDGISDDYGNIAEDGIFGAFLARHPNGGHSWLGQTVVEGSLRFTLLARNLPAISGGNVSIGQGTSQLGSMNLAPLTAASPPNVSIRAISEINSINLTLGPIATSDGFLLSDGADVHVRVTDNDARVVEIDGWVADGSFQTIVPLDPSHGPFRIETQTILGKYETTKGISNLQ